MSENPNWLETRCSKRIKQAHEQNLLRRRRAVVSADSRQCRFEDQNQPCLNFSSNDYLGIASGLALPARQGYGAGASPLVNGYWVDHQAFEQRVANYLGFEAALLMSSGYSANADGLATLLQTDDLVFGDRLNHSSLTSGVIASGARLRRYRHNDLDDLKRLIEQTPLVAGGQRWIVTDAVFSMDGDVAPLVELANAAKEIGAALVVDDAHGFGVFGGGRGTIAALGLSAGDVDLLVVTFGKAVGASGACICAKRVIIDALVQSCRAYIYSTAMPPAMVDILHNCFLNMQQAHAARAHLATISQYATKQLHNLLEQKYAWLVSSQISKNQVDDMLHPVLPLVVNTVSRALAIGANLEAAGFLVGVIRPPTVPIARLRIAVNALHELEDIDDLIDAIDIALELTAIQGN